MPTIQYKDPTTGQLVPLTSYTVPVTPPGRNRLINGDFSVNQRGFTSVTGSVSNVFGLDRWFTVFNNGASCVYSVQSAAPGDLPESARQYARIVSAGHSGTSDRSLLCQRIESVRSLSGKTATISFWARAASGTPKVAVEFSQVFGGGGSTTVSNYAGTVTLTTLWARYSITMTLPSIAGKTIGTDDNLGVILWTSAGSDYNTRTASLGLQSATIDFWGVQVEEGPIATPFEQKSYAEELRDCMRYYEQRNCAVNNGQDLLGVCYSAGAPAIAPWQFMVPKRIPPTISFPVNGGARYINTVANQTGLTMSTSVNKNLYAAVLATSTNQAVSSGWLDGFTVVADAELP